MYSFLLTPSGACIQKYSSRGDEVGHSSVETVAYPQKLWPISSPSSTVALGMKLEGVKSTLGMY